MTNRIVDNGHSLEREMCGYAMRLCVFNDSRLGVVVHDSVVDVTATIEDAPVLPAGPLAAAIDAWHEVEPKVQALLNAPLSALPLSYVRFSSPLPRPGKLIAAPVNYRKHMQEMSLEHHVSSLGVFLKATSSVIGPGDEIRLPYNDRRFDYEAELALIVGRTARNVAASEAARYVFGYTCLFDITMRGDEDRSTRKSFDTFTPVGPWVVTADEVTDPGALVLECWVNGELRQKASTSDLIWGVPQLLSYISSVMTLYPGDIITTGTPEGVGPLADGDELAMGIDAIGRLELRVSDRGAVSCPTRRT